MAAAPTKKQTSSPTTLRTKSKKKRPGIHSKKKSAKLKSSKNYVKTYKGQGR
jgi:hypothetical protein